MSDVGKEAANPTPDPMAAVETERVKDGNTIIGKKEDIITPNYLKLAVKVCRTENRQQRRKSRAPNMSHSEKLQPLEEAGRNYGTIPEAGIYAPSHGETAKKSISENSLTERNTCEGREEAYVAKEGEAISLLSGSLGTHGGNASGWIFSTRPVARCPFRLKVDRSAAPICRRWKLESRDGGIC